MVARALALALLAALAACGGGGGTDSPPAAPAPIYPESFHDYLPWFTARTSHGVFVNRAGTFIGEWYSTPGRINWGASIEHWREGTCDDGVRWALIDGYESSNPLTIGEFYRQRVAVQTVNDIPLACEGGVGVYLPMHIPAAGVMVVEQWLMIWADDQKSWRPAYWRAEYRFGTEQANPCWRGEAPNLRRVIVMREAWWDEHEGWLRGSAPTLPWRNGVPVPVTVQHDFEVTIARGAGIMWQTNEGVCLRTVERQ